MKVLAIVIIFLIISLIIISNSSASENCGSKIPDANHDFICDLYKNESMEADILFSLYEIKNERWLSCWKRLENVLK